MFEYCYNVNSSVIVLIWGLTYQVSAYLLESLVLVFIPRFVCCKNKNVISLPDYCPVLLNLNYKSCSLLSVHFVPDTILSHDSYMR